MNSWRMHPVVRTAWKRARKASDWLSAKAIFAILRLLRLLPPRAGLDFAAWLGRTVGPWMGRHRLATANLHKAYPEKDAAWIEATARGNWEQMARLAAEYVFLDEIFDFDPARNGEGLVEVEGIEIFEELRDRKGPFIFFTGHLGAFELLPICAATYGLEVTALFRPPNNRFIAREILSTRRTRGGHLVPSKAGAAWALAGALDRGASVGMLVDQKFKKGAKTTFFGRECRTNPLVPKLARQFDCEIYPARSIRLPNGRYRLELKPRIALPRGVDGAIDVQASCQMLNDIVEGWVREHPEQWMWFHRRWQV